MNIDITSLLAGISITAIGGWISSFLSLRKDERAIQIDQVTKERTKWRDNMRKLTEEAVLVYFANRQASCPEKVAAIRSKLVTSLNPKDQDDDEILSHYDDLFAGTKLDVEVFTKRIALLLKHDWERVKWDCTPIYVKPIILFTKKQLDWRSENYRKIP